MKSVLFTVIAVLLPGLLFADHPPLTAEDIIKKANHMSLYQGQDAKGTVQMKIIDGQGRIRHRAFNILRKNADAQDHDQFYFTCFQRPADVRKMVFMVHKHASLDLDDDRWLYMPSLDLVKRIAAGDKRTSFVGSDFLYEDISGRSPEEDHHTLSGGTEQFFTIKSVPKKPGSVEFEYAISSIDRQTFLPMKMEFYTSGNRRTRVIEVLKVKNIASKKIDKTVLYPTAILTEARNLETGSRTTMAFSNITYNTGIADNLFTERFLRRPPRDAMR